MDEKRFEVIYKQGSGFGAYFRILRDRETEWSTCSWARATAQGLRRCWMRPAGCGFIVHGSWRRRREILMQWRRRGAGDNGRGRAG